MTPAQKKPNTAGAMANEPPVAWSPSADLCAKPEPRPVTRHEVEQVLKRQVLKWNGRKQSLGHDDIDNLMDAETAYQLLADQAQLIYDLLRRIQ